MGRIFQPAQHLTSWRRLAPHVWDRPHDPTVYGVMDLVVDRALPVPGRARKRLGHQGPGHPPRDQRPGARHPAHAASERYRDPASDRAPAGRRHLRPSRDRRRAGPLGTKLTRVDAMPLAEIARELATRAARVRRHADPGVERTKSLVQRLPNAILGLTIRAMEYLLYDLQLDLSRFGIESDQFGSAMVSNIGNFEGFGMSFALAPLVPISRCPIVVLIGEVQKKPVVEGDRIVARSVVTLGCTFDHRMIDGAQGTAIAAVLRRVVEDPEKEIGPVPARSTSTAPATGTAL